MTSPASSLHKWKWKVLHLHLSSKQLNNNKKSSRTWPKPIINIMRAVDRISCFVYLSSCVWWALYRRLTLESTTQNRRLHLHLTRNSRIKEVVWEHFQWRKREIVRHKSRRSGPTKLCFRMKFQGCLRMRLGRTLQPWLATCPVYRRRSSALRTILSKTLTTIIKIREWREKPVSRLVPYRAHRPHLIISWVPAKFHRLRLQKLVAQSWPKSRQLSVTQIKVNPLQKIWNRAISQIISTRQRRMLLMLSGKAGTTRVSLLRSIWHNQMHILQGMSLRIKKGESQKLAKLRACSMVFINQLTQKFPITLQSSTNSRLKVSKVTKQVNMIAASWRVKTLSIQLMVFWQVH